MRYTFEIAGNLNILILLRVFRLEQAIIFDSIRRII